MDPNTDRHRTGLRRKIILWSFIPTVIILVSVAVVTYIAYQQVTQNLVIERDQELTRLSAGQLATEMRNYSDLLTSLARTTDIQQQNPEVKKKALDRFANQLVVFDGGVLILNHHGIVITGRPDRPEIYGQDWSDRAYFGSMVRSPRPVYSNIVEDGPDRAPVIVVAVPILGDQGEFLGTLQGMFRIGVTNVSALYGGIVKQRIGASSSIYVVDGNGRVIYHVDSSLIGNDLSNQLVVSRVMNGETGAVRTRNLESQDIVAGYAQVPGSSWGLISEERWSVLTQNIQGYGRFLLLLLGLGVVIPVLMVAVGVQRITQPIEDLITAAKEVARGNFDLSISAHTGDEIEELANQFNWMAGQLRQSYTQLEQRVQDRTKELAALYHADEELLSHLDVDQVSQALVDVAVDILNADKSSLFVWDDQGKRLVVAASRGFSRDTLAKMKFIPGEGILGKVALSGEPAFITDALNEQQVARFVIEAEKIKSFMHVPIKIDGRVYAIFNVNYYNQRSFPGEEQRLFMGLAQRASLAFENAQLYEKAQYMATVEERQRLARELHDAVTQTLFSSSLIAEVLPRLWEINQDEARRRLEEIRQLTRGALAEMRTLLLELRPSTLMEAEMNELFRHLADAFTGRARIPVDYQIDGTFTPPPDVKIAMYRIAQEALNNVVKHAQASQVKLRVQGEGEHVRLSIEDNGCGFDLAQVTPDHLGLGIMRERAERIGAGLSIKSEIGKGTAIQVTWSPGEPSDSWQELQKT
jgi:nitrate/nitrite-specific signal transduction histidine kinase